MSRMCELITELQEKYKEFGEVLDRISDEVDRLLPSPELVSLIGKLVKKYGEDVICN